MLKGGHGADQSVKMYKMTIIISKTIKKIISYQKRKKQEKVIQQ